MGTQRLFVAIYPPADVAGSLLRHAAAPSAARAVVLSQVHLTLHFVGEVDARDAEDVRLSVRRSAAGQSAFRLTSSLLTILPEKGPARIIAAVTDVPPQLAEIRRRLVARLARPGRHQRESFLPHVTLARFPGAGVARPEGFPAAIREESFGVSSIVLVRSHLSIDRAVHEPVEIVPLEGDVRPDRPPQPG